MKSWASKLLPKIEILYFALIIYLSMYNFSGSNIKFLDAQN